MTAQGSFLQELRVSDKEKKITEKEGGKVQGGDSLLKKLPHKKELQLFIPRLAVGSENPRRERRRDREDTGGAFHPMC